MIRNVVHAHPARRSMMRARRGVLFATLNPQGETMPALAALLVQFGIALLTQGPGALAQLIAIFRQTGALTPEQADNFARQLEAAFTESHWKTDAQLAAERAAANPEPPDVHEANRRALEETDAMRSRPAHPAVEVAEDARPGEGEAASPPEQERRREPYRRQMPNVTRPARPERE